MNTAPEWIKGLGIYLQIAIKINEELLSLSNLNISLEDERIQIIEKYIDISTDFYRIVPCKKDKKRKMVSLDLDNLMSFRFELKFLEDDLKMIFNENNETLYKLKIIRDKAIHLPHKVKYYSSYNEDGMDKIIFDIAGEKIEINTNEVINVINALNKLFNKMILEFSNYIKTHLSDNIYDPYINKIINLNL